MLLDPDNCTIDKIDKLATQFSSAAPDLLLVGGSLVSSDVDVFIKKLKSVTTIPIVLFPGSATQFSPSADGLLLLSLISGRNPDFLIGQHVISAPAIAKSNVEVIPTGYMLIDGGAVTSVQYISGTMPIPSSKDDIAMATAQAGQLLGLKVIYLEAGSGATRSVPTEMISAVRNVINIPLIVGGGIRSASEAKAACKAGADIIVIGNALEKDASLLPELCEAVHSCDNL